MEQSNGSLNVNETDNKNYSRTEIEGTPFTQINSENGDKYLVMGDYRITGVYKSEHELQHNVKGYDELPWNLITTVVAVIIEQTLKMKGELENVK